MAEEEPSLIQSVWKIWAVFSLSVPQLVRPPRQKTKRRRSPSCSCVHRAQYSGDCIISCHIVFRKDCCGVYIMDENRLNQPYSSVFTNVLQYIVPHQYFQYFAR